MLERFIGVLIIYDSRFQCQKHPDYPKKPLTSYMIFYMEKKDEILEKQPGLGMVSLNFRLFFTNRTLMFLWFVLFRSFFSFVLFLCKEKNREE